jgi:hypothetical protein
MMRQQVRRHVEHVGQLTWRHIAKHQSIRDR